MKKRVLFIFLSIIIFLLIVCLLFSRRFVEASIVVIGVFLLLFIFGKSSAYQFFEIKILKYLARRTSDIDINELYKYFDTYSKTSSSSNDIVDASLKSLVKKNKIQINGNKVRRLV